MCRVTQSAYVALLRAHVEEQGWGDVVSNQVTTSCRLAQLAYLHRVPTRFAQYFMSYAFLAS